jgi:hypothetical protein
VVTVVAGTIVIDAVIDTVFVRFASVEVITRIEAAGVKKYANVIVCKYDEHPYGPSVLYAYLVGQQIPIVSPITIGGPRRSCIVCIVLTVQPLGHIPGE